jgi:Flp pilus assembly protein TadG
MTPRRRARRARGQSLVEVALMLPIVILVTLGGTDLAQAYRYSDDVSGASRAGMRIGIQSDATDIGSAVRTEPNSVVANSAALWGATGPGGTYDHCTNGTTNCGDPNGCPASVFTGTRVACFAIHACALDSTQRCTTYSSWGLRPEPDQSYGNGLEVVVVYKFTPNTPLIAQFAGAAGSFLLTSKAQGLELYY